MNILDRMGIPSTTIGTEKTVNFIENDGRAFYVPSGEKVTFTVNLNPSASVELVQRSTNNWTNRTECFLTRAIGKAGKRFGVVICETLN